MIKLHQDNSEIAKKISEKIKGTKKSLEERKQMSIRAKKRGFGGHTSKKAIYYKMKNGEEVYLQSNYEVKVAEELDLNNIEWNRPNPLTWIDENGIDHRYYPDFYLPEYDVYLDPKNDFLISKDYIKIKSVREQNNVNILMFGENHLEWNKLKELI